MTTLTVTTSAVFGPGDFTPTVDQIVFDSSDAGFVVATFDAALFDDVQISQTVHITPDPDFGVTFSQVNVTGISGTFSAAGWTFPAIPANIFMFGSNGDDTITGNAQTLNAFRGGLGADTLIGGDTFRNAFIYADPLEIVAGETVSGGDTLQDSIEVAGVGGNFNFSVATLTDIERVVFLPGLAPTQTTATLTGAQAADINFVTNASGGPAILKVVGSMVNLSSVVFVDWTPPTDKVTILGTGGANGLIGSSQPDTISGAGGNDVIRGGGGNDLLIGGKGRDVMYGDAGHDRFDFNSLGDSRKGSMRDVIQKFSHSDDIDLKGIDAKKGTSGNQKFKFIGKQDFHDKKGELHYIDKGSKCLVQGDVNGDGKADFEILVKVGSLNAGDFSL